MYDTSGTTKKALPLFASSDFTYDADARSCVCPAGKSLYRRGASYVTNGYVGEHFRGAKRDGVPCAMRMQQRLDAPEAREQYGQRFATVKPVFANVRYNKRLDRFTLRDRTKLHGQWLRSMRSRTHDNVWRTRTAWRAADVATGAACKFSGNKRRRATGASSLLGHCRTSLAIVPGVESDSVRLAAVGVREEGAVDDDERGIRYEAESANPQMVEGMRFGFDRWFALLVSPHTASVSSVYSCMGVSPE